MQDAGAYTTQSIRTSARRISLDASLLIALLLALLVAGGVGVLIERGIIHFYGRPLRHPARDSSSRWCCRPSVLISRPSNREWRPVLMSGAPSRSARSM